MSAVVGENYGDNTSEEEVPEQQGTRPGEGKKRPAGDYRHAPRLGRSAAR
jgi:hypothetical protein